MSKFIMTNHFIYFKIASTFICCVLFSSYIIVDYLLLYPMSSTCYLAQEQQNTECLMLQNFMCTLDSRKPTLLYFMYNCKGFNRTVNWPLHPGTEKVPFPKSFLFVPSLSTPILNPDKVLCSSSSPRLTCPGCGKWSPVLFQVRLPSQCFPDSSVPLCIVELCGPALLLICHSAFHLILEVHLDFTIFSSYKCADCRCLHASFGVSRAFIFFFFWLKT